MNPTPTPTSTSGSSNSSISVSTTDLSLPYAKGLDDTSLQSILGVVYFWAGIVAVLIIIVGGIRYTTSNGDASKIKSAKDTITYAIVGLVVVIMAAVLTQFVIFRTTAPAASTGGTSQAAGASTP